MAKILVVEDDIMTAQMISDLVESLGHTVELVYNGDDAIDRLKFYDFDLAVLDWQMPGKSGVEVCKTYRANGGKTPILMLTGKNTIDDKEEGFDSGADDYLTKPFEVRELKMRVQAMLRRPVDYVQPAVEGGLGLTLDYQKHCLIRDGQEIALLPKEFAVLEFLFRHPNQYFTPETLLNKVWPSESDSTIEALRTCIKRIRKKVDIENDTSIIATVRGYGYRLELKSGGTNEAD
jgi:OmpR-family two-component system manganese-sensing response regulator